jgi:hypothetical protein
VFGYNSARQISSKYEMVMASEIRLLALAALVVAFAGATPALRAFNSNFGSQYSRHDSATEIPARTARGAEASTTERKNAEVSRHDEAETKISLQASQLRFLYTYYIWMEMCVERFSRFDSTKTGLREVLRSKEAGFPSEQADSIWNATAEKFKQLEGVLHTGGDARLYSDCEYNSRYVEGLLTLASQPGGQPTLILRRKDF